MTIVILAGSPTSSPDFNRSNQPKFLTGPRSPQSVNNSINQHQQQQVYQNIPGPPTTGLFDYLKNDKSFQTPTKSFHPHQQNQSYHQNASNQQQSFHNQSGFNQSRIMSPISNLPSSGDYDHSRHLQQSVSFNTTIPTASQSGYSHYNFWITVFGFPESAVSSVLAHFSQCGSILAKVYSAGNWIHLKFSSRLECDKALLYNGKIIYNNLMIGVLRCTDDSVIDKENNGNQRNMNNISRVRSLTQAAYKSAQEPTEVVLSPNAPKRTTGIINKTLDMFFGW